MRRDQAGERLSTPSTLQLYMELFRLRPGSSDPCGSSLGSGTAEHSSSVAPPRRSQLLLVSVDVNPLCVVLDIDPQSSARIWPQDESPILP